MKRFLVLLLSVALACGAVSCAKDNKQEVSEKIRIYLLDNQKSFIDAANQFNKENGSVNIDVKIFSSGRIDKFIDSLAKDFSNSGGPDIILFNAGMLSNLNELINNGNFFDLNQLIQEDNSFNIEDYNEKILKCGIYNSKRYFIPLNYSIPLLFTTKEALANSGIGIEEDMSTWNLLSPVVKNYMESTNIKKGKYLFDKLHINDMIDNSEALQINFESKKVEFNTAVLSDLFEIYQDIFPCIYPQDMLNKSINDDPLNAMSNLLAKNEIVICNYLVDSFESLLLPYSSFDSEMTPLVFPLPGNGSNTGTMSYAGILAGINSNSKNKESAMKYIKLLLSNDFQMKERSLPVNNEAYQLKMKKAYEGDGSIASKTNGVILASNMKKIIEQFGSIIERMAGCRISDNSMNEIIRSEVQKMLAGKLSIPEVVQALQHAIDSYLQGDPVQSTPVASNTVKDTFYEPLLEAEAESDEVKKSLSMYLINWDTYFSKAIDKFNSTYRNIKIEKTIINDYQELNLKIATEMAAGKGPDIMCIDGIFPSIHKAMDNGSFFDLNKLIEKDGKFKTEDFNSKVLECGIYKGKRYLLPLSYHNLLFYTSQESLTKNGIEIDPDQWTLSSLADIARNFKKSESPTGKYLFDPQFASIYNILYSSGINFIDFENKKAMFNSNEFVDILNIYKEIYPLVCPFNIAEKYAGGGDLLSQNVCVFLTGQEYSHPFQLSILNKQIKDLKIISCPNYRNDGKVYSKPVFMLGINNRCKYPADAFNYIKIAIGNYYNNEGDFLFAPSYKKNYNTWSDEYLSNNFDVTAQLNKIDARAGDCILSEFSIDNIIHEEVSDFLNEKKSAKDTAKSINDKVMLYLNE